MVLRFAGCCAREEDGWGPAQAAEGRNSRDRFDEKLFLRLLGCAEKCGLARRFDVTVALHLTSCVLSPRSASLRLHAYIYACEGVCVHAQLHTSHMCVRTHWGVEMPRCRMFHRKLCNGQ